MVNLKIWDESNWYNNKIESYIFRIISQGEENPDKSL